jgi:hypothetical protein
MLDILVLAEGSVHPVGKGLLLLVQDKVLSTHVACNRNKVIMTLRISQNYEYNTQSQSSVL